MKVVILAGGKGTRLSEETDFIPKPMSQIAGMPIILHIMKIFCYYKHNEFIILAGYKGHIIKEFFKNYFTNNSIIKIKTNKKLIKFSYKKSKNLNIKILQTGENTQTGGRILRARNEIGSEKFFLTYGDCLADINIHKLLKFHNKSKKIATVTGVNPKSQYGALSIKNNLVTKFSEKPYVKDNFISGGFFVLSEKIFDLIKDDTTILERKPMETLVKKKELSCYQHKGFWHPMDSLRDKRNLEKLWKNNRAPWKKFFK